MWIKNVVDSSLPQKIVSFFVSKGMTATTLNVKVVKIRERLIAYGSQQLGSQDTFQQACTFTS